MNLRQLLNCVPVLSLLIGASLPTNADPVDPTIGEWKTFGNGPSHTGFYPTSIGSATAAVGWSKSLGVTLNQVAVSDDKIYLTTNPYFGGGMYAGALSTSDGVELWRYPLPEAFSLNPPTFDAGRVFFQRCNHSGDTYVYSLNSASGALLWAAPHAAQWGRYQAPTVVGDGVWVNGGYYGGMYGFNVADGAQRFFIELPQEDGWTPSYYGGVIYSCVEGILKATDPRSGSDLWTRDLRPTGTSWYGGSVVALLNNRAYLIGNNSLVAVDLDNRSVLWRLAGAFVGTPATDGNAVYAIIGNAVRAYSVANGDLLATYTASATLSGQPLVLNDAVFAASSTNTFLFSKTGSALRQTLPSGGALSYARGVLYSAETGGKLSTYNMLLSQPEPTPTPTPTPSPTPTPTPTPVPTPTPTPSPTPTPTPTPNPTPTPSATVSPSPTATPTPTPPPNPAEPAWLDAKANGTIAYFAFAGASPHLERFDMQARSWLPRINLSGVPTAFAVDDTGIYVSFGRRTARLSLDGATETHLVNTVTDVNGAALKGNYLYLVYSASQMSSIDKATGVVRDAKSYSYSMSGVSIAPTRNKIFARSTGVSPSDIIQVVLNADGTLGAQSDSPYHGAYPSATRTYVFPNDAKVVDDAGIVYNTTDLTYVSSLAGSFTDAAFSVDRTVVLRTNTLVGYSNVYLETGRYSLAGSPLRIFISGNSIYSFYRGDTRGVFHVETPLSALLPGMPGGSVDPTGLAYTPDSIKAGENGVIYLLSRAHFSVFRWSVQERRYLPTISLVDAPTYIAYSATNHALYLAYPGGRINRVTPAQSLVETPFANLPDSPLGLSTAGEFVFAADPSGAWASHYTFGPGGTLISSKEWNYYSTEYIWSAANRKMYFFRDDSSPNDLLSENIDLEGMLGAINETPYHDSTGFAHPIRLAPGGGIVVLGSGRVFNAISLVLVNALSNNIADADWLSSGLFTIRPFSPSTEVQAWSSTYSILRNRQLNGNPLRLLTIGDRLVAITQTSGVPVFTDLDANLNILPPPDPTPTPTPTPSPTPTPTPSPTPPTPRAEPKNISTRGRIQTGDDVMIAGFIVTGSGPRQVVVRAIGPSLTGAGVPGALLDPMLELHKPDGSTVTNDDWRQDQQAEIIASTLAPTFDSEAAIVATLSPGAYTAIVRGKNATSGVGLVEVFDLASETTSSVANVSTRGRVETNDNVMIGGFILGGGSPSAHVIVRAIGPSLTGLGVPGALQDTTLSLHDSNGNVTTNDNWQETQEAEINATGVAPTDPRESAIVATLPPGNYTAIVRGKGETSGVGLVEVYRLP